MMEESMNSYAAAPVGRPSSALAHPKRVVLTSQLRNDNFHLTRLSRLQNDAHVRKGSNTSQLSKSRPTANSTAQLATTMQPASRMSTSGQKKTQISYSRKFQNG